jgi:hypothetical protein
MMRIARKHVVVVVVAVAIGAAASAAVSGAANSTGHHYVLRTGDSISIPSLRWSCLVARAPTNVAKEKLLCTTDGKPVSALNITRRDVSVSAGIPPKKSGLTYTFRYRP